MCALCDEVGELGDGIGLTDRPAHRLAGLVWEGSHAEAAAGALHPLIARARAFADDRAEGLWRSPVIGLSLDERADGFRYFVGISVGKTETPGGMEIVDLPEMVFASIWHLPADGDVNAHYLRMADRIRDAGLAWDRSRLCRREEYPPDFEPGQPPSLRLMLPLAEPG